MNKDRLYTCTWRKTSQGFEVRSVDFPEISGQGKTLFKAEEQFAFKLSDRVQQWPAAFGYTVPPPADEEFERFQLDWILIESGNVVLKQKDDLLHLFEGGACVNCGAPRGPRTKEVFSFDYSSSSVEDVAYVKSGPIRMQIYSRQFVDSVFGDATIPFEVRPTVRRSGRCRKEYFERIRLGNCV